MFQLVITAFEKSLGMRRLLRKEAAARIGLGFALLLLAVFSVAPVISGTSAKAIVQDPVPGFQGTVNHYRVGMHAGCPDRCSQWMNPDFRAFPDGRVESPITIENDSMRGFCGRIRMVVRDAAGLDAEGRPLGRVLGTFVSPKYCIQGKPPGKAIRYVIPWSFQASPAVGQRGADLYGVPEEYEDIGMNWGFLDPFIKIAEAIITVAATQ